MVATRKGAKRVTQALLDLQYRAGVRAAILVTKDGLVISSALPADIDEDALSAMTATLLSTAERVGTNLKEGSVVDVVVRFENGYVITRRCGDEFVLTVLSPQDAKLGLIQYELKKTVEDILNILG